MSRYRFLIYNETSYRNINLEVVIIRKVDLNMTEQYKYKIIKKLVEINGNKKQATLKSSIVLQDILIV